jgi:hypothetical protein
MTCLSDDDQRYACAVAGAEGKRDRVRANGRESQLYDDVVSGTIRFVRTGAVDFVARQGRRVMIVTIGVTPITFVIDPIGSRGRY